MQRDRRDVAVMQVFERVRGGPVHPTGAGGHGDDEHGTLERADSLELLEREAGALRRALGRVQTHVDAQRVERRPARLRRDVGRRRTGGHVLASRPAEVPPLEQRRRAAGGQRIRRALDAGLEQRVERAGRPVDRGQHGSEQHAVDGGHEQREHDREPEHAREPRRREPLEAGAREPPQGDDEPAERNQHDGHDDREQRNPERMRGLDGLEAELGPDRVLPRRGPREKSDHDDRGERGRDGDRDRPQPDAAARPLEEAPQPPADDADAGVIRLRGVGRRGCGGSPARRASLIRDGVCDRGTHGLPAAVR